jgi:hypothetical protein
VFKVRDVTFSKERDIYNFFLKDFLAILATVNGKDVFLSCRIDGHLSEKVIFLEAAG